MDDLISRQAVIEATYTEARLSNSEVAEEYAEVYAYALRGVPSAQPEQQHGRIFQEIVVEYPSISTYPEHEGKPYFSIKYTENGQGFIGYGTYKPEVLSEYLKEYFMPHAQPERKKGKWIYGEDEYGIDGYHCDKCGFFVPWDYIHKFINYIDDYKFCPHCGAEMRRTDTLRKFRDALLPELMSGRIEVNDNGKTDL